METNTTHNSLKIQPTATNIAPAEKKTRKPREEYIPLAERFRDVPDVVWDIHCQNYLTDRLAAIASERKKHKHIKPNEQEILVALGLWHPAVLSHEFLLIAQKKSKLSGVIRNYIETLLIEGMNHSINHYREIETKRATLKSNRTANKLLKVKCKTTACIKFEKE